MREHATTASRQLMPSWNENVERYTPAWLFAALGVTFDLDPCAPAPGIECPSKSHCRDFFSWDEAGGGLVKPWRGLVWLNPPWTRGAKSQWVARLAAHGDGIALVRGGVDSRWLHANPPAAIFMFPKRVQYIRGDGQQEPARARGAKGGFEPSMLIAFGARATRELARIQCDGIFASCSPRGAE